MAETKDRHTVGLTAASVKDAARSSAEQMGKYFGPLRNRDIETFASDAFAHETHNLPRAYVGRNKFLMATIDFLITKDDDWYTRHVLPWLFTEEIHVKWNIWRFNRTMMDYEPEQGVPRYVSYESESRSDSLVRRGLAFIIEHGFYKTEIGRQHYLMNLKQIVEAVHETVYYGVMHELMASPNFYEQWQRKHGRKSSIMSNDAVSTLAEERWRFACVQKDIKGLFVLDAEVKDRMRRVGIEPDSWIFPSKMAIYASMVPEYFNEYSRGGAPATTALEDGAKRFDTFRGNRVFETRSFDTDFMSEGTIEPLVRTREIGEYYVLGDEANDYAKGMQIFDMSRDKFHTIPYNTAIDKSFKGGGTGTTVDKLIAYYRTFGYALVMQAIAHEFPNQLTVGNEYARVANAASFDLVRGFGGPYTSVTPAMYHFLRAATSPGYAAVAADFQATFVGHRDDIVSAFRDHKRLYIPHKILLFRPRMTYTMATAILLKGGDELGSTLHGHHDFQLTDDVIHKTHIGHYTFYSKSVVREPKNMYMAEDIYCTGYEGGENTEFVSEYSQHDVEPVKQNSASIISIAFPYGQSLDHCLSLLGHMDHHGITTLQADSADGQYATSDVLMQSHRSRVDPSATTAHSLANDDDVLMNGICFRGAEKSWNDSKGQFVQRQHNTGHWGPNVYDGCAMVRMGMYAHLKNVTTT